jgi:hypothetical protein
VLHAGTLSGGDEESMMNLDKAIINAEESHVESFPMAVKLFGKTTDLPKGPPDSAP